MLQFAGIHEMHSKYVKWGSASMLLFNWSHWQYDSVNLWYSNACVNQYEWDKPVQMDKLNEQLSYLDIYFGNIWIKQFLADKL